VNHVALAAIESGHTIDGGNRRFEQRRSHPSTIRLAGPRWQRRTVEPGAPQVRKARVLAQCGARKCISAPHLELADPVPNVAQAHRKCLRGTTWITALLGFLFLQR
jgi:hypothetical protein